MGTSFKRDADQIWGDIFIIIFAFVNFFPLTATDRPDCY